MNLSITTPPVVEPVSVAAAKAHLLVTHDEHDVLIGTLIEAAREYAETKTGRPLVVRTHALKLDAFPVEIELPFPPLVSVTSITYTDGNGDTQTVSADTYVVDTTAEPGVVRLAYGQSWPSPRGDANCITVSYVAGYAASFTVDAATDVLTISGRTLTDADIVRLSTTDGDLPAGLSAMTDHHVRDVSGSTFKLAATAGGAAIDITDAGTETHFVGVVPPQAVTAIKMLVGHWYEHREAATDIRAPVEVPLAVESLLGSIWFRDVG